METGSGYCWNCDHIMMLLKDDTCSNCGQYIPDEFEIDQETEKMRFYLAGRYGVLSEWGNISDYWLGKTKLCE